jgi:transcriptional regulator with XRE-family HTH domain
MTSTRKKPPAPERVALGRRIANARQRAGMSQSHAARRLGISVQSFRQWESGRTSPKGSRLVEVAQLFFVSVDELLGKETQQASQPHEHSLLETYRRLPPHWQRQVLKLLEWMWEISQDVERQQAGELPAPKRKSTKKAA